MDNYKFIISFIPVILYYLVYYRYFSTGKSGIKFLSAFLSGTGFALFLILVSEIVSALIFKSDPLVKAFVTAGLIEKGGAFVILYVLFRDFKGFSVREGIITGMFFALGFACVENIFYVYDQPGVVLYMRVIFSVPLHITTCGMVGFYMAIAFLCSSGLNRFLYMLKSILVPLFFHGFFDFLLIKGGPGVYAAAPVLIISAVLLEVMLARSGSIYSKMELQVMGLDFEAWRLKDRQPRYDRWVKRYTGILKSRPAPFFAWNPGIIKFTIVFMLISASVAAFPLYSRFAESLADVIRTEEAVAVFILLPLFLGFVLIISGAVNPMYFVKSLLSLPVISDVELIRGNIRENLVTNDLTSGNCFLQTTEPIGVQNRVLLRFKMAGLKSGNVTGKVVWENHRGLHDSFGSLVSFTGQYRGFYWFIIKYNFLRLWKGAVFLFRLPGFDALKGLFYKPFIITQEDIYFKKGDIIFREGDRGDRFYMLKKGRVIFYKQKEDDSIITVSTAVTGEVFGELAVLGSEDRRNATAICAEDTIAAVATRENLETLLMNNSEFVFNLLSSLTSRVIISEKIFFENIKELEMKKAESEKLAHMTVMLILMNIGFDSPLLAPGGGLTINKMIDSIKSMGDGELSELTLLLARKQEALKSGDDPGEEFISDLKKMMGV